MPPVCKIRCLCGYETSVIRIMFMQKMQCTHCVVNYRQPWSCCRCESVLSRKGGATIIRYWIELICSGPPQSNCTIFTSGLACIRLAVMPAEQVLEVHSLMHKNNPKTKHPSVQPPLCLDVSQCMDSCLSKLTCFLNASFQLTMRPKFL